MDILLFPSSDHNQYCELEMVGVVCGEATPPLVDQSFDDRSPRDMVGRNGLSKVTPTSVCFYQGAKTFSVRLPHYGPQTPSKEKPKPPFAKLQAKWFHGELYTPAPDTLEVSVQPTKVTEQSPITDT